MGGWGFPHNVCGHLEFVPDVMRHLQWVSPISFGAASRGLHEAYSKERCTSLESCCAFYVHLNYLHNRTIYSGISVQRDHHTECWWIQRCELVFCSSISFCNKIGTKELENHCLWPFVSHFVRATSLLDGQLGKIAWFRFLSLSDTSGNEPFAW